jgi:hypothetical protein
MEQQTLFKVRDLRQKTQFKVDDKYLNGYARVCGSNATLAYLSLCRHAEFESQRAFPSQKKMAFELGISENSIKRGIKSLVNYNIIEIKKEKMGGKFANNVYYLLDKSEWETIDHTGTRQPKAKNHRPKTIGHTGTLKDNKNIRITNNKDNKEISIPFLNFWDLYDKKVGSKEKIQAKWNRLSPKDQEAILKYIPKYKEAQPEKRFRKNPETFLNNKSWEDEIISSVKPKKKKVYFNGNPVVEKQNGQKYVISNGEWIEFVGLDTDLKTKWE